MAINVTLGSLSQTAASNGPDGNSDAPSVLDDAQRNAGSFTAIIRDAGHVYATGVAGSNTITGSLLGTPTAYATGQTYAFIVGTTNTGATTLNLSSLGAKNIYRDGAALVGGELIAGRLVLLSYDGTQFQLQPSAIRNKPRTATALSGTDVDFTVPLGQDNFRIVVVGASTSGTNFIGMRLGDSGGIETTGYAHGVAEIQNAAATVVSSGSTFILLSTAVDAASTYSFVVDFQRTTGFEWVITWTGAGGTTVTRRFGITTKTLTDTLTTVRLTTSLGSDTFDAGNAYLVW